MKTYRIMFFWEMKINGIEFVIFPYPADYVLVYEETHQEKAQREKDENSVDQPAEESHPTSSEAQEQKSKANELAKKFKFRKKFLSNLEKIGLDVQRVSAMATSRMTHLKDDFNPICWLWSFLQEVVELEKKCIYFLKLHAPWDVLCYYAEDLSLRAPLQVNSLYDVWKFLSCTYIHQSKFI